MYATCQPPQPRTGLTHSRSTVVRAFHRYRSAAPPFPPTRAATRVRASQLQKTFPSSVLDPPAVCTSGVRCVCARAARSTAHARARLTWCIAPVCVPRPPKRAVVRWPRPSKAARRPVRSLRLCRCNSTRHRGSIAAACSCGLATRTRVKPCSASVAPSRSVRARSRRPYRECALL